MHKILLIPIFLLLTGCFGAGTYDALTVENLEYSEQLFEDTHRPIVADDEWVKLSEDEQALTIPESEYKAAKYFFTNAIEYENSKKDD